MTRASAWIFVAFLAVTAACGSPSHDPTPRTNARGISLPLPAERPSDFALQVAYQPGSGTLPSRDLRVDGDALTEVRADLHQVMPRTPAQLDQIYDAARRLTASWSRPPSPAHAEADTLRISVVADGQRYEIDSSVRGISFADRALLAQLEAQAAEALAEN